MLTAAATEAPQPGARVILRLPAVMSRTGLKKSTIYAEEERAHGVAACGGRRRGLRGLTGGQACPGPVGELARQLQGDGWPGAEGERQPLAAGAVLQHPGGAAVRPHDEDEVVAVADLDAGLAGGGVSLGALQRCLEALRRAIRISVWKGQP